MLLYRKAEFSMGGCKVEYKPAGSEEDLFTHSGVGMRADGDFAWDSL